MSEWMTIRVELIGRADDTLASPPGRVLLARSDHVFADLADAVNNAFGRWDLTPLHEFTVDGLRLVPGGDPQDLEAQDSEEITLGETGIATGEPFTYVFDLGEGWDHDCRVEQTDVEADTAEADGPIAVFGWGSVPDQYGRETEDDDQLADDSDDAGAGDELDSPDDEVDFLTVAGAVPGWEIGVPDEELASAAKRLRTEAQVGLPPFDTLFEAAGLTAEELPPDDDDLWVCLAAGTVQPQDAASLDPDAEAVWSTLEPADWAGMFIGLLRGGVGQSAEPEVLAHLIASSPDVDTEPVFGEDREAVVEALGAVVGWWQALCAVDGDRRLTALGRWGLPHALRVAWTD